MSVLEIFDDIVDKQVLKTETGDARIFGVLLGIVSENHDKNRPGEICVTIPVRDNEANELKWAKTVMPYSGSEWGFYFQPEIGDQVLLAFEGGNIEKPYMIGAVPKIKNKFLKSSSHEKNRIKKIQTKNGNIIALEDDESEEGEKDKITIQTGQNSHSLVMDNEKKKISLSDKDGNCSIEMDTKGSAITLKAEKRITISSGDIEIKLNGSNGTLTINAKKININADNMMAMEAGGTMKINGKQAILEASSMLKQASNGSVAISGSTISIG